MFKMHTHSTKFVMRWSVLVTAAMAIAAGAGVAAFVPAANAQPPGTLCGHIENRMGGFLPVIVLNGNPDCFIAVDVAQDYLTGPQPADGGTLQLQNVRGVEVLRAIASRALARRFVSGM